ncbi:MAG: tRNA (adenosine(37)-N6)-threonylcarbamoyltransferase complex ATPase subunit type 1 TsaE [Phycisphaerales bacterium]
MQATLEITSISPEQTAALGAALGALLREGDVLALHGDLGAGKTCLVRGIAAGLGLDTAQVSSPTFVIVSEYTARAPGRAGLVPVLMHVDAYRLSGPDDLDSIGWERVIDGSSIVVVEWAERLSAPAHEDRDPHAGSSAHGPLGDPAFLGHVHLAAHGAPDTRRIRLDAPPAWAQRPGWSALLALARAGVDRCPTCRALLRPDQRDGPHAPFCSERCRGADLGRWFAGQYMISREVREDDAASSGP